MLEKLKSALERNFSLQETLYLSNREVEQLSVAAPDHIRPLTRLGEVAWSGMTVGAVTAGAGAVTIGYPLLKMAFTGAVDVESAEMMNTASQYMATAAVVAGAGGLLSIAGNHIARHHIKKTFG